jgi:putative phosphoesterase
MRAILIADTHITRTGTRRLRDSVYRALQTADLILHAGDVVVGEVLDDLARFAPAYAVLGNNDRELDLPGTLVVEVAGVRIGMIHDSGPRAGRERRLARRFPDADLVVFGHSHIPLVERDGDRVLFNPGSPTDRRRQPHFTIGTVDLEDGRILRPRLVVVDP